MNYQEEQLGGQFPGVLGLAAIAVVMDFGMPANRNSLPFRGPMQTVVACVRSLLPTIMCTLLNTRH